MSAAPADWLDPLPWLNLARAAGPSVMATSPLTGFLAGGEAG
jgi:hypothetical protein